MSVKYNPWEDSQTFLQEVGNIQELTNQIVPAPTGKASILPLSVQKEYDKALMTVDLLEELDNLTTVQYTKLRDLEVLYEKYKYQLLLSQVKNEELIKKLNDLCEVFKVFETNRIKIVNLIHNAGLTDNNVVKIKHNKKMELIKILKICTSDYSSVLELVELNENIHKETVNKLRDKVNQIESAVNSLISEMGDLSRLDEKRQEKK